jgi:recombination protein RecA
MLAAAALRSQIEASLQPRIARALTPAPQFNPELAPTGIAAVDALTGGVPLGCLTEICGPHSSGRISVLISLMRECMRCDQVCALVDASDAFDPHSAAAAGMELNKLLWVRCGQKKSGDRAIGSSDEVKSPDHPITRSPDALEQALKSTDLLLQAGGFGLVVLDLGDIPVAAARRIPLTTWFRFRRAVEHTATALVVLEQQPHAKSCASLVMDFTAQPAHWSEAEEDPGTIMGTHFGGSHFGSNHFGSNPGPAFRVNAQGIAVPFERPSASSFETPQRWNIPHARLLNAVHVHLQVSRVRGSGPNQKFSPQRHGEHGDYFQELSPRPPCGLEMTIRE